jgi:asparagine synthetase B (glutamine-hydrolysing)
MGGGRRVPGFLYVRSRRTQPLDPARRSHLETLARRLAPDNIPYRPLIVAERNGEVLALFNGGATARRRETSVCLGSIFDCPAPWWKVGSGSPDGSFGLVRSDDAATELMSDAVGTRTLWHAQTADEFIASTSQRAIVMWLQSYDCNADVFAWQLSSGTLGPGLSWDRRIRALPPASRLLFDREAWSAKLYARPVEYRTRAGSPERQRDELRDAIEDTFRGFDLDTERGALALSGGYDSRMILLELKDRPHLNTVTWGQRSALADRRSDAHIAEQLATKARTTHSYYAIDVEVDHVREVLDRFVRLGEGRTENVSGYMDGFALWKDLHERGLSGLFRGDEGFGCRAAPTPADVYRNMKCNVLADFHIEGASPLADLQASQRRPEHFERRPSESLAAWRDRLNAEYELPYVIGPLNDLKFCYLDVIHPLVSRRIVEQARGLPDELRTDKRAFKSIVEEIPLDVPFATRTAIAAPEIVLRQHEVLGALREGLRRQSEGSGTVAALARYALERLPTSNARDLIVPAPLARLVERVQRRLPRAPRLNSLRLGFRTYTIGKMQALLEEDARAFGRATSNGWHIERRA